METLSYNRLHCMAGANPFHNGHLALFQECLKLGLHLDVSIGRKLKPHRLPWEVRHDAMRVSLECADIQNRVSILTIGRRDVDPSNYDAALLGSNLLLSLFDIGAKSIPAPEKEWFFAFPNLIVCERFDGTLTQEILDLAKNRWNHVNVCRTRYVEISGTFLCKKVRDGLPIQEFLPNGVWEVIEPHLSTLSKIQS